MALRQEQTPLSLKEIHLRLSLLANSPHSLEKAHLYTLAGDHFFQDNAFAPAFATYAKAWEVCGLTCETGHPQAALIHLGLSRITFNGEQYDKAQLGFKAALDILEQYPDILHLERNEIRRRLAQTLIHQNRNLEEAGILLETLLREPPQQRTAHEEAMALLELGKIHFIRDEDFLATEYLGRAIGKLPGNASLYRVIEAHIMMELLMEKTAQTQRAEEARKTLEKMLLKNGETPWQRIRLVNFQIEQYTKWKAIERALTLLDQQLAYFDTLSDEEFSASQKAWLKSRAWRRKAEAYMKTEVHQESNVYNLTPRIEAMQQAAQALTEAILLLEPFEEHRQEMTYALIHRGKILSHGFPGKAIPDLEKAIELLASIDPHHADLSYLAGKLADLYLTKRHDPPKAEQYYRLAIRYMEENGHPFEEKNLAIYYQQLGNIYYKQEQLPRAEHNFAKALTYFDTVDNHKAGAQIRESLVEILRSQKKYPELYDTYVKLQEHYRHLYGTGDDRYHDMLFWAANIATSFLNDPQRAEAHLLEAIELKQSNAHLKKMLAHIYFKQEKYKEAQGLFEELLDAPWPSNTSNSPLGDCHWRLAAIHEKGHRRSQAIHHYREALKAFRQLNSPYGQEQSEKMLGELRKLQSDAVIDGLPPPETP